MNADPATRANGISRRRALAAAAWLGLSAAAAPALSQAHDTLTIGIATFPPSLQPLTGNEMVRHYIIGMMLRPLMTFDSEQKLVCHLCTAVPSFENGLAREIDLGDGKKGVALTLTLHADAVWGDGTPLTVKDVIFSHAVKKHPESGNVSAETDRRILKIEAKDDKTFVVHLDRLTFDYNDLSDYYLLPAHIEGKAFAQPAEYAKRSAYETDPTQRGLALGPYRVTEFAPGSHVVLVPNEAWFGRKPYFKRIVVRTVANTVALEANLLAGGVDYIPGEAGLTLDQVLALEARHPKRFNYVYRETLSYSHIDLNLDHAALKDKRVRQALLLAIDRGAVARSIYKDKIVVAHSWVSPRQWMIAADVPKYPFDPARARTLLDEAGWSTIKNGIRHNAEGERLSFGLVSIAGVKVNELIVTVLAAQWRQVGVEVRARQESARVFFGDTTQQRKFDGMAFFSWISSPEWVPRDVLHSSAVPAAANNWQGQNFMGFRNAEMDSLIDRIEREVDRERRRPLWQRFQALYADELPALPLYFGTDGHVMPLWLEGVVPTGNVASATLWVEQWRAK